jgi:hypothetical protein
MHRSNSHAPDVATLPRCAGAAAGLTRDSPYFAVMELPLRHDKALADLTGAATQRIPHQSCCCERGATLAYPTAPASYHLCKQWWIQDELPDRAK